MLATKACEISQYKDASLLEVLAAAFAESGDYDRAVKWQEKANTTHVEAEANTRGATRLGLYKNRKPLRGPED